MKCFACGKECKEDEIFKTGVFTMASKENPGGTLTLIDLCQDCRRQHEKHAEIVKEAKYGLIHPR